MKQQFLLALLILISDHWTRVYGNALVSITWFTVLRIPACTRLCFLLPSMAA